MNLFVALVSEFWWIAPTAVAAGTAGGLGWRWRNTRSGRRLGYDAAKQDLRQAEDEVVARRVQVRVARTEYARLLAERGRDGSAALSESRSAVRHAEKAVKAAAATVRSRRAQVDAARAEMSAARDPAQFPLARVRATHDAVTARWMDYETDPAKLIAFPTMSDVREPATAAFFTASERAQWLRPQPEQTRVATAQFTAYRDAVADLERAFHAAERAARTRAGIPDPSEPAPWQEAAQQVISRSAEVWDRAAGAAASAFAAWNDRNRPDQRADPAPPAAKPETRAETHSDPGSSAASEPSKGRIWPVPRRDGDSPHRP